MICHTVYPKKCAHGFCFAVLCCGYTLTDFLISIRLTSLALWQSNDCPSASKATLMNMDKYFMWIHYERLHNHNKAKHNKTVCIFLGIYCISYCITNEICTLLVVLCCVYIWSSWCPSQYETAFPCMMMPIIKIRRPWDCRFFIMGIPIQVKRYVYIETDSWWIFWDFIQVVHVYGTVFNCFIHH